MKPRLRYILLLMTVIIWLTGCENKSAGEKRYEIAVANSYLQCVAQDLCGSQIDILSLVPPGMCPGHFDISPSQVSQLCNCKVLLIFDFQRQIEGSLQRLKKKGLTIYSVSSPTGLCIPQSYLSVAEQVTNILSNKYPQRKDRYHKRLRLIEKRLESLSKQILAEVKRHGLGEAKVLCSNHQVEFTKWLGLDVVSTFVGSDTETAANINRCLLKAQDQQVRFVIANKQEGTALAESLADRLKAKVVTFSNFPNINNAQTGYEGFDGLLRENIRALLEAAK